MGIDTSKSRNADAEGSRGGKVRYLGEFRTTEAATRKLVAKLAAKFCRLTICYEAGPTWYGLYRLIKWVPDERHEAMRDLLRARQAAKKDLQGKRQQISSLMLRSGAAIRSFERAASGQQSPPRPSPASFNDEKPNPGPVFAPRTNSQPS